jgi:hypothetical protein
MSALDLDALEREYTPRRHNEGDERVVALILRLRAAEAEVGKRPYFGGAPGRINELEARIAQLERVWEAGAEVVKGWAEEPYEYREVQGMYMQSIQKEREGR